MSAVQTFGSWLRQRRRALDLTQDELARRIGCAPITIRKLEADEMRPSKQLAEGMAEHLGIPPAERQDFVRFARAESKTAPPPESTPRAGGAPWRAVTPLEVDLPFGTVTLLFSDIAGSTQLLQRLGDKYPSLLSEQRHLLRQVFGKWNGREVDTEGDGFFAAFPRAGDAVSAAVEAQRALAQHEWPDGTVVRVRMALHTGEPTVTPTGYVGLDVHRAARICAAADGGQVLLSNETRVLVEASLPHEVSLLDLGEHRLKDLQRPEHLFQLVIAGLDRDFQPLKTLDHHPNNLPAQPTPFLGREQEVAAGRELLLRGDVRLLTLTGAGGSGKTRLALQICSGLIDHSNFQDGVFFIPLASIREPALVILTLAQIVGVKETAGRSIMEFVIDALHDKQMLLLLDNFEQVIAAAPLVAELLATCTRLKVVVTSREVLHLRGERELPVPPLSLPDLKQPSTPQVLAHYAAVELFVQRAIAVKPNFELTNENAPAVAEICARVDGLPLAIELAAARVKLLPPQAMLKRLEHQLSFLTGGARDLPARQQRLRSTIDWSYDLLTQDQQTLLNRMCVFIGGCTLEAAETVCNVDGALNAEMLDVLALLIDQSLLRQEEMDGEPRFGMLEIIREYGLERLEAKGERGALSQRHADYYLAFAERADPLLETPEQARWLDRLQREYDNLRAALDWFADTGQAEQGLRLGIVLWRFWAMHGYLTEGRARLEQLLALPQAAARTKMRMKALYAAGVLADAQCDYDTALSLFEENLAISREVADPSSVASALINLGNIAYVQGNYQLAHSSYTEALEIFRDLGESLGIAWSLKSLANVAQRQGDYAAARMLYEEELEMWRRVSIPGSVAVGLNDLGNVAHAQGDYGAARSAYEQSLTIFRELGHEGGAAIALHSLGNVVSAQGDYAAARGLYAQSLAITRALGDKHGIAHLLESFANLAATQGQLERAVHLLGAAAVLRTGVDVPLSPAEQTQVQHTFDLVMQSLPQLEFNSAWAKGKAMTLDEAIAFASEGGDSEKI